MLKMFPYEYKEYKEPNPRFVVHLKEDQHQFSKAEDKYIPKRPKPRPVYRAPVYTNPQQFRRNYQLI